jgi:hypothetical protein
METQQDKTIVVQEILRRNIGQENNSVDITINPRGIRKIHEEVMCNLVR